MGAKAVHFGVNMVQAYIMNAGSCTNSAISCMHSRIELKHACTMYNQYTSSTEPYSQIKCSNAPYFINLVPEVLQMTWKGHLTCQLIEFSAGCIYTVAISLTEIATYWLRTASSDIQYLTGSMVSWPTAL